MTTTINTQAAAAASTHRPILPIVRTAGLASLAGLAVAGVYEALVRAAGVSLEMGASKAEAEPIPAGGFVGFTAMFAVAGLVLAIALARWAKHPARTYALTAWTLVAASLALPFLPAYLPVGTRLLLAASHLAVAGAVIPLTTRALRA